MKMKIKLTREELLLQLKNFSLVFLGTLVLAFGCAVFVVPFEIVTGGVTGLSIVINHVIQGAIHIDVVIFVLTCGQSLLGTTTIASAQAEEP